MLKGENPTLVILMGNIDIGLHSDIYRLISCKLSMVCTALNFTSLYQFERL